MFSSVLRKLREFFMLMEVCHILVLVLNGRIYVNYGDKIDEIEK